MHDMFTHDYIFIAVTPNNVRLVALLNVAKAMYTQTGGKIDGSMFASDERPLRERKYTHFY